MDGFSVNVASVGTAHVWYKVHVHRWFSSRILVIRE